MENSEISKMGELNVLIDMIVDYYSFKSDIFEDEDTEKSEWDKEALGDKEDVVPGKIHSIIEKVFIHQLTKYSKD